MGSIRHANGDGPAPASLRETQTRFEAGISAVADAIADYVPGLTWRFNERSVRTCDGGDAARVYLYVLFDGPVPDDKWPRTIELVTDAADSLGAANARALVDRPGDHTVVLTGPDGVEFEFGTKVRTTLSAMSGCLSSN